MKTSTQQMLTVHRHTGRRERRTDTIPVRWIDPIQLPPTKVTAARRPSMVAVAAAVLAMGASVLTGCMSLPRAPESAYADATPTAIASTEKPSGEIQRLPEVIIHMDKHPHRADIICGPRKCRYVGVVKLPDEFVFAPHRVHIPAQLVDLSPEPAEADPYVTMNVF